MTSAILAEGALDFLSFDLEEALALAGRGLGVRIGQKTRRDAALLP